MIDMSLEVDTSQAEQWLVALFADQMPFATSRTINATALDFQRVQRRHMSSTFEIRRKRFMERSVKIKPFATKRRLAAKVSIDSPRGRSDIFGKFETDRRKTPFRGRSIAVPTSHVPRTGTGVIRNPWRPGRLFENAQQHGVGPVIGTRANVFRGARGTFIVRRPGGRGTIFQRKGGTVRPLYQLVPSVPIDPELEFERNARATVAKVWARNFGREFERAVISARSRPVVGGGRALASLRALAVAS